MRSDWKKLIDRIYREYEYIKMRGIFIKKSNEETYKNLLEQSRDILQGYKHVIQNPDISNSSIVDMFNNLLTNSVEENYKILVSEGSLKKEKESDDILEFNVKLIQEIHSLIILSRGDIIPESIENKYNILFFSIKLV